MCGSPLKIKFITILIIYKTNVLTDTPKWVLHTVCKGSYLISPFPCTCRKIFILTFSIKWTIKAYNRYFDSHLCSHRFCSEYSRRLSSINGSKYTAFLFTFPKQNYVANANLKNISIFPYLGYVFINTHELTERNSVSSLACIFHIRIFLNKNRVSKTKVVN